MDENRKMNESKGVVVKMSRLTEGIGIVFQGVVTMLEALDASSMQKVAEALTKTCETQEKKTSGMTEREETHAAAEQEDSPADCAADESQMVDPSAEGNGGISDQTPQMEEKADSPEKESATSAVTEDDITRIIVRKIKQNRSNNEKIGAILKSYGAARVSDLLAEQYEAFLTDVSQL